MTITSGSLVAMAQSSYPLQFLLVALAGWINQHQRDVIDYLQEENRALREQLGPRRLRFMDDQRRRLAAKAKILGRRILRHIATIVKSDTLLSKRHGGRRCIHAAARGAMRRTAFNGGQRQTVMTPQDELRSPDSIPQQTQTLGETSMIPEIGDGGFQDHRIDHRTVRFCWYFFNGTRP